MIFLFYFAGTLNKDHQIAFLVIFSAVCWTLWKYRNTIIFQDTTIKTIRSLILLIPSLFEYWSGHMPKKIKNAAATWLPTDIDAISLRVWDPSDNQLVLYQRDTGAAMLGLEGVAGLPAE